MTTTIYYFSATGNSLKVAADLRDQLEDAKLVKISKKNLSIIKDTTSDKLGFVYPIFFWGLPAMVKEFIENLQINKDAYIFAVATYGGFEAISFNQIDDILHKKGAALSGCFKVLMPGSYQVKYPPFPEEKQAKLFKGAKEQILRIAASVNRNETNRANMAGGLKKSIGGLVYRTFLKLNDKDKNFWNTEECNGCGICSRVCPADNIEMMDQRPRWKHQCEHCLACLQWCPQKSIQYQKSTLNRGRYHHPEIKVNELFSES